ncbi:MAG: prepilin-type N-terminal cleavage/methylation domain-containing protein [Myxococcota bacterium]
MISSLARNDPARPLARPQARGGFTLLEVLAAVMIFAAVVTILIGSSSETIHRAQISRDRLQASEIADREMAMLEAILSQQESLPQDKEELGEEFTVRMWSESALDNLGGGGGRGGAISGDAVQALATGDRGAVGIGPLLAAQVPGIDVFLRRYEIRVEWTDGAVADSVRRTTFAFDWQAAREALPDLFAEAGGEGIPEGGLDVNALGQDAKEMLQQLRGG